MMKELKVELGWEKQQHPVSEASFASGSPQELYGFDLKQKKGHWLYCMVQKWVALYTKEIHVTYTRLDALISFLSSRTNWNRKIYFYLVELQEVEMSWLFFRKKHAASIIRHRNLKPESETNFFVTSQRKLRWAGRGKTNEKSLT